VANERRGLNNKKKEFETRGEGATFPNLKEGGTTSQEGKEGKKEQL